MRGAPNPGRLGRRHLEVRKADSSDPGGPHNPLSAFRCCAQPAQHLLWPFQGHRVSEEIQEEQERRRPDAPRSGVVAPSSLLKEHDAVGAGAGAGAARAQQRAITTSR